MAINILKTIERQKKKIAKIEAAIAKKARSELEGIHSRFGFESLAEFFSAARSANEKSSAKRRGRPTGKKGRRKRAKITPELKAKVIAGLKAGKTGAAVASEAGISLPSVQNIKKEAGLVKPRP
jgi:hypothetical protein